MPRRWPRLLAGMAVVLWVSACSPTAQELGSRLIGTWEFQADGINWKWAFNRDGSVSWKILGQTDMGGKSVDIAGDGSYSFDGAVLLLRLNKFAGVPGMWRSQEAAPGFDPTTKVKVRFAGKDAMNWSFSTEALGAQDFKVSRND